MMTMYLDRPARRNWVADYCDVDSQSGRSTRKAAPGRRRSSTAARHARCWPSSGAWRRARLHAPLSRRPKSNCSPAGAGVRLEAAAIGNGVDTDYFSARADAAAPTR